MAKSPYLENENRLADVIAAIQVLGSYKFYKLDFDVWADRIVGDSSKAEHWKTVFEQHPEFFRLDVPRKKASLVWRRQHQKLFDVDSEDTISREKYWELTDEERNRISRTPLNSDEIGSLIGTAVNMHDHALMRQRDSRWWVPLGSSFIGAVLGGGGFTLLLKWFAS